MVDVTAERADGQTTTPGRPSAWTRPPRAATQHGGILPSAAQPL
ncbi:MAG: hypothetical protein ACLT98_07570 [Eggerthellaceae bacterium]